MKQPSFLARKTPWWPHWPNYFLIAMALTFLVAFVPRGVRKAVEGNTNKAEDWLPSSYAESIDLRWFRDHFMGEQFALISWDGCTLGNDEKLQFLAKKLIPSPEALANAEKDSDLHLRARWYKNIISGPAVLEELMAPPLSLDYGEAISRIEGALVGPAKYDAEGNNLGPEARTTCLIVYLTEEATRDNRTMRQAIEKITEIASTDCGIAAETIHMGGPPVDNITIDVEGEKTLVRLASLAGIVGLALSYWCFRSMKLTSIVFAIGVLSAGMSLAIVFYFGILEVTLTDLTRARLGTVDAILMSMPAVVYVLGLSGAIHIVNYYRDARRDRGLEGAAESAVKLGWGPCTLAAFTTAVGLGSLYTSDILPIKKFGMFTAIAVMATVAVLFSALPVFLHRFPVSDDLIRRQSGGKDDDHLPSWAKRLFGLVVGRYALTCFMWAVVMGAFGLGFNHIQTSVSLLKLLDPDTDLIHDYTWLEENLANLVPMEVVLTIPQESCRTADEHAEDGGNQYRNTLLERLNLARRVQSRIEELPEISRVMSVATYTPKSTHSGITSADRSGDYAKNRSLEENLSSLHRSGYLRLEKGSSGDRELWRISARVAALGDDGEGVDYGEFVQQLKTAVDPVLVAYQQRDMIVEQLHAAGKRLDGAQICVLYRTPDDSSTAPAENSQESVLSDLLRESGVEPRILPNGKKSQGISKYNLAQLDAHKDDPQYLEKVIAALGEQDALVLVSAGSDPTAKQLADGGLHVIDVSDVPVYESSAALPYVEGGQTRPIRAVYTGMIPLVYKTQRQLLYSLKESIIWATVLIAGVMMFVLRSPIAGLISMIPNVFPIIVIFGGLGWLGIKVDIGIMMTASVALGVAVDDTVHFLTWFRRGISKGMTRVEAIMLAYDRCATAMLQTTIIGGLGLAVFATSTFTPTQQFGYLMISMLAAALVGDLLLLPAILASPFGWFFGGSKTAAAEPAGLTETAIDAAQNQPVPSSVAHTTLPELEPQPLHVIEDEPLPTESSLASSNEQLQKELQEGPHAALHAKLRSLRRESTQDSVSS
ncbi:MAG: MMPL family transporter [Planctomycetales bacterium]|nr:MMPL family transporter [Planctomycetales bacterium]